MPKITNNLSKILQKIRDFNIKNYLQTVQIEEKVIKNMKTMPIKKDQRKGESKSSQINTSQRQIANQILCPNQRVQLIKVSQIILNQLNEQLDQLSIIDEIELEQFRLEVKRMDEAKSLKSISSSLDSDMQIETFEHSRRSQDSFFTSEEKVDQRSSLETQETSMLELFNSFIQKGQNQESTCETSIQSSPNREFEDNIMQKDHIPMQNRADKVEQIPIQQQPSPLIRIKLFQNVDQNTIQSKQIQTNQKDIIQQPNIKLVKKSSKKKAQVSPPKFQFVKYTKAKQQNLNVIIEDEEDSDIEVISFEDFKVSQRDSTQPDKRNSLSNSTSSKSFSESIKSQNSNDNLVKNLNKNSNGNPIIYHKQEKSAFQSYPLTTKTTPLQRNFFTKKIIGGKSSNRPELEKPVIQKQQTDIENVVPIKSENMNTQITLKNQVVHNKIVRKQLNINRKVQLQDTIQQKSEVKNMQMDLSSDIDVKEQNKFEDQTKYYQSILDSINKFKLQVGDLEDEIQ
eukprot:403356868